jgi:hypothetical protein
MRADWRGQQFELVEVGPHRAAHDGWHHVKHHQNEPDF